MVYFATIVKFLLWRVCTYFTVHIPNSSKASWVKCSNYILSWVGHREDAAWQLPLRLSADRHMIFLKERSLPSALWLRQQWTYNKRKKERLTDEASKFCFVRKPFLFPVFWFFRQSLVSVAGCFLAHGRQWQGFRAEYAPQEEDSARNGSAAWPCRCYQSHALPLHPSIGNEWLAEWNIHGKASNSEQV